MLHLCIWWDGGFNTHVTALCGSRGGAVGGVQGKKGHT